MTPPANANIIKIELTPPPIPPIPPIPPPNIAPKPAPMAKPANGPNHLLRFDAGACIGAGATSGALRYCCEGIERLLPKLLPPPKRLASAAVENSAKQVSAIVSNIKKFFM